MKLTNCYPVDAGSLSILDYDWVVLNGGYISGETNDIFDYHSGPTTIKYNVDHPYVGEIKGEKKLTLGLSGRMVVGDAGYLFDEETWFEILEDTDYLKNLGNHGFVINTYGDGFFDVTIETI